MRPLTALALCLVLAACGPSQPTPAPSAQPGARAAQLQAPYLVTLELPRDTWKAGEPITGAATLSLVQGADADVGGAGGGLLAFEYASVDGVHHVEPVSDAACATYHLVGGVPMTTQLSHSGAFYPEQPDFEFNRAFITAPDVRLPAGDWKITAIASFVEGQGCSGASRTIKATVTVHITP
jgi:hypothetical protein